MVKKTIKSHVLHALAKATTIFAMFDVWMSHRGFDTFALVVNYSNKQWVPCHVIVEIFEVHETIGATMAVGRSTYSILFI
jgi:hypothetical protein